MNSKLKLLKILEILMETDEQHPLTALQINEKLKLYGIEAERKSICRDINILRDDADYDILLSADNKQGYYMASRDFEDWEVKILIDAVSGAKFLTTSDTKKLANKLIRLQSKNSRKMMLHGSLALYDKSGNVTTKIHIDEILKAIKAERKISFQYTYTTVSLKKELRRDGHCYVVNPYRLVWKNDHYYLIGNYDKYDNLSSYRLDRMKHLSISEEACKPAEEILGKNADIRIDEHIKTSIYNYGGEKIKLTLEVEDYMVDDLIDYFGSDLIFVPYNEKYRVTVDVMDSEGLYYWLLQYEKNVKVIAPIGVREKLIDKAKGILDLYREDIIND